MAKKRADGKFPVRVFLGSIHWQLAIRTALTVACRKIILPPAYNFAQYDGAQKLFVLSPHSEDFNNFFFGVYLINEAVLNIYTSGICAG